MATQRLTATVHGLVQGVSFRYYTRRQARQLGLTGWVRNERDGTVALVAEGDEAALSRLRDWLEKGPPAAQVARVESQRTSATGEFDGFQIVGW